MHLNIDKMSCTGWRGSVVLTPCALALILGHGTSLDAAKKGSKATLEQFTVNKHIKIYPKVYNGLSQTEYSVFSCKGKAGSYSSMGLIMRFKRVTTAAYYANLYSKMDRGLKA